MADQRENDSAAVTIAKVFRMLAREPDAPDDNLPSIDDVITWDADGEFHPNIDCRLDMDWSPERLAKVKPADARVVWREGYPVLEVRDHGVWRPLREHWILEPDNDNFPHAAKSEPVIPTTRRDLSKLDTADRDMFGQIVDAETLADLQHVADGDTSGEIGEAAGFGGKQAEAVGLDRTRRAVRTARRAFGTVERINRGNYWWRSLHDDDLVPGHLVKQLGNALLDAHGIG
jgi:hypothetical protein